MPPTRYERPTLAQRHPVAVVTSAVLALQAAVQGLVAQSVSSDLWWQTEWVRLNVRLHHPAAAYAQQLPKPGWQTWVPPAVTAVLATAALVGLGLLLARAGRGWWVLLVAALPLVPAELAPGSWGPPLLNQAAYALVWPAGATEPDTTWAWMSAAVTALLITLPATTLTAAVPRRPLVAGRWVLGRLALPGIAAAAVLAWQVNDGTTPDPWTVAWWTLLATTGALAVTGALRPWVAFGWLLVLPALAGGIVRWTTSVDGTSAVLFDWSARTLSFVAVAGGLWALGQPAFVHGVRAVTTHWYAAVVADVAARNAARAEKAARAEEVEQAQLEEEPPGPAEPAGEPELVSPGPSPAGRGRAGGRHRA